MPARKKKSILPKGYKIAHDLCFTIHDILLEYLISGEASGAFVARFDLPDADIEALKALETFSIG
jgi:hypothetical protein